MKGFLFLFIFALCWTSFAIFALFGFIEQGHSGDGKPVWVGIMIASIFIGIGISLFLGCFLGIRNDKKEKALRAEFPDQPWLLNKEWRKQRITDSNIVGAKYT